MLAVWELVHGLVGDVAEGTLPEVMALAVFFVDLALGVEGRDVGR